MKARLWKVEIRLRGGGEPIAMAMSTQPESWVFRSLKPEDFIRQRANTIAA